MIVDLRIRDVASSNIKDIKYISNSDNNEMTPYNAVVGTLTIVYSNDAMYNYLDVPITYVGNMLIHESVGKFVSAHIKKLFKSERVGG